MEPTAPIQPAPPVNPAPTPRPRYTEPPGWDVLRIENLVYIVFGVVEGLILIRFILLLLAANPNAGFSNLIYNITAPLVAPFQGVFPTPVSHNSVLEVASLLAIIVYALIAWAVIRLIDLARRGPTSVA